jgi:hypothetical protein
MPHENGKTGHFLNILLEFGLSALEFSGNAPRKWQNGAF